MITDLFKGLLPFKDNKSKNLESVPGVKGAEKVNYILGEYNAALDFNYEALERTSESFNLYSGINESQYPDEIKAKMAEENRNPFQANFIRSKVNGLAGSIIKNFFDISYEPINGEHTDLTRYVKNLMLSDKEKLDWNSVYKDTVIDGLIHLGIEEMYISFRYSPLGNIGFRRILPGHVLLDPNWLSNNAWDLRRIWKSAFLTPREIKEIYKTKAEEVDNYIKTKLGIPSKFDNGDDTKGYPHYGMNEIYGDKFRVIEFHHLEKEKRKVEVVVSDGTVVPEGPNEFKREWAIANGIDLSDGVMSREEDFDCYYVTTICPTLSRYLVLEDKKALIQIGRLPFFPWSCARINGINSGIPDLLKSIQRTYNYRESMMDYMISSSANGAAMIDPDVVDGDENRMRLIAENWNKPNFKMFTRSGALASGREFIKEFPKTQVDYGVVNEINRMIDMADMVSQQPAAMDARSEGSEESGILYARKQLQAEVTQTILLKGLEQHHNEKGEAYFLLAQKLYSGVYREFYFSETGEKIEINKPIITPSGEHIENDISTLPRMKVIVSQSPEGITNRAVDRAVNTEILRMIPPELAMSRSLAVKNIMNTLDISRNEKQRYEESADIEYMLSKERAITELMRLKTTQLQMQAQLGQLGQPQIPNMNQIEQQQKQPQGNPGAEINGANAQMAVNQNIKL